MLEPEINLNGWVTIKTLAAEKECSTQYIYKLINEGLPVREFAALNGLKLVPSLELQKQITQESK